MMESLLVANRGEIAARVLRTANRMGLRTIAVYSEADAGAPYLEAADEAYLLGPAAAAESYLKVAAILRAAAESGAAAIHPGYGFLSENAAFASACRDAGHIFVGPSAEAIDLMGSKRAAKAFLAERNIPVVPGYQGEAQDRPALVKAAGEVGFPLLIKASAGGGGKGMRVVSRPGDLEAALTAAAREAAAAFGDGALILERFLAAPRHIELQVFRDRQGRAVQLFERDCSLQRRHQKVVEEAPAPGLTPALRQGLAKTAIEIVHAVDYEGAGTIEFLVEGEAYYFMEMNTRLQVEHPVTEMITGLDLVEWQLRIAAGEPLPLEQADIVSKGHALEARLYAEDPRRGFLPAAGTLRHLRFPEASARLRIESGVIEGSSVSSFYDPMIAKLVAWGEDREAARLGLIAALAATELDGPASNRDFLARLLADPAVIAGAATTGFIEAHDPDWLAPPETAARIFLLAALAVALDCRGARVPGDPGSPWEDGRGWRLNRPGGFRRRFARPEGGQVLVEVAPSGSGWTITLDRGPPVAASGVWRADSRLEAVFDGETVTGRVRRFGPAQGGDLLVIEGGACLRLSPPALRVGEAAAGAGSGRVLAPLSGRVVELLVAPGDDVARGAALLVLEAMKMEHRLTAPMAARVAAVDCAAGDLVSEGALLVELAVSEPEGES